MTAKLTGAHVASFAAGVVVGLALVFGQLATERERCRVAVGAARVNAAVSRADDHARYVRELESCQGANAELAAVLHEVVSQGDGCRGFLRLAAPRPAPWVRP